MGILFSCFEEKIQSHNKAFENRMYNAVENLFNRFDDLQKEDDESFRMYVENEECDICLNNSKDLLKNKPCNHYFCNNCIELEKCSICNEKIMIFYKNNIDIIKVMTGMQPLGYSLIDRGISKKIRYVDFIKMSKSEQQKYLR